MKRKCLAIGIILLFIGTIVIPSLAQDTEKPLTTSRGVWLYVGGSGPGNYTRIQDAINDSSSGDTIFVYNGTYHEALRINVASLTVIGEGRKNTIIDAYPINEAVVVLQDDVVISGFRIIGRNYCICIAGGVDHITISNNNLSEDFYGVEFETYGENKYNIVENNVFYSNSCGISIHGFSDDGYYIIRNNTFVDNWDGIYIGGKNNELLNNTFIYCRKTGIFLHGEKSIVEDNIFIGNEMGLDVDNSEWWGSENRIIGNHFENNTIGLRLNKVYSTLVTHNNFIHNKKHAAFYEESRSHGNLWVDNYWDVPFVLFGSVFIFGKIQTNIERIFQLNPDDTSYFWIRWINFDRNPAQEPYDIPGMR